MTTLMTALMVTLNMFLFPSVRLHFDFCGVQYGRTIDLLNTTHSQQRFSVAPRKERKGKSYELTERLKASAALC
jgi:hypothetical protein